MIEIAQLYLGLSEDNDAKRLIHNDNLIVWALCSAFSFLFIFINWIKYRA